VTGPGTVYLEGDLRPGHSPAEISFGGDLIFGSAATLVIDLAGDGPGAFDVIGVAGLLSLDGALDVRLIDGFVPALGNTFDILDWSTRTGTFSTVLLPGLEAYLRWDLSDLYLSGEISVTYATVPGDANLDGAVDQEDAAVLAAHWGQAGDWSCGNFNGDTVVDAADASILAANWGYDTSESGAVPEPGMIALLLGLGGIMVFRCGRHGP
jgi:hypothetical protein